MMVEQGLASVKRLRTDDVHLDIDTTVEWPSERNRARFPVQIPVTTDDADAPMIKSWVRRFRARIGEHVMVTARIDAGGDCASIAAVASPSRMTGAQSKQCTAPAWRTGNVSLASARDARSALPEHEREYDDEHEHEGWTRNPG